MLENAHATRAFIAFLVTWSFVVLTLTGLVLYVVPPGRVSNWIFWSLAGLDKNGWTDLHILFGAVFIVSGAIHLYFNWKPFSHYLAERVRGHVAVKREAVTSLAATVLLIFGALFALPPVSWLFDLNDWAKSSWSRPPGDEPPYPRAETPPLPVLAERLGFDLDTALETLGAAGISITERNVNLETLAKAHSTTPAALYALIPKTSKDHGSGGRLTDPAQIEAQLAGTGLGMKTLAGFAEAYALAAQTVRTRLAANGIKAEQNDTLKAIAERHSTRPIEIAKVLLAPGYVLEIPAQPSSSNE